MADKYVQQGSISGPRVTGPVVKEALPGDLVYWDGTRFALADADAHTSPAEYVVVGTDFFGADDKRATLSRKAVIVDADAPYTVGDIQYLSTTAAGITTTRPSAAADLNQVVGRAISTSEVEIDIQQPRVLDLWFAVSAYDTSGEPGLGVVTDGWPGPGLDGAGETAYIVGRYPLNFLQQLNARIVTNNTAASALDYDFSVVAGYAGGSNAGDTGTAITAADADSGAPADNILESFDVDAMLDAGLQGPGRLFSILIDPDGVGSGEQQILGLELTLLVA